MECVMKHERGIRPKRPRYVLPTESAAQLESEQLAFEKVLKPRDKIEQMYVEDLAYHDWKMSERRRIAFAILKAAQTDALFDLLVRQLEACDSAKAQILVERWAKGDSDAKLEVSKILNMYGLDETAIEADAYIRAHYDDRDHPLRRIATSDGRRWVHVVILSIRGRRQARWRPSP